MRQIKDFFLTFSYLPDALVLIVQKRIWIAFIFPPIIFFTLVYYGEFLTENIKQVRIEPTSVDQLVWHLLNLYVVQLVGYVASEFSKYLVVMCLAPLIGFLSGRVEKILTGKTYDLSWRQLWIDLKRGAKIVVRNLVLQNIIVLALMLACYWLPQESKDITFGISSFIIGCYFYGFSFMDYFFERRKLGIQESIEHVRYYGGIAMAVGLVYSLLFLIPWSVGATIGPILAVVLATLCLVHKEESSETTEKEPETVVST